MKKLTLILGMALMMVSCKKEDVKPTQANYEVFNYVSQVPMYSVKIHNDTLTCEADNQIFEYVKYNDTEFRSIRCYWKSTNQWQDWTGAFSWFQGNTLYITF